MSSSTKFKAMLPEATKRAPHVGSLKPSSNPPTSFNLHFLQSWGMNQISSHLPKGHARPILKHSNPACCTFAEPLRTASKVPSSAALVDRFLVDASASFITVVCWVTEAPCANSYASGLSLVGLWSCVFTSGPPDLWKAALKGYTILRHI